MAILIREEMMMNKIENELFAMAKPYLGVMQNEMHTVGVIEFALELLHEAGGDRKVVIPAAILHDVGWSEVPEEICLIARTPKGDPELVKIHETKGAAIAKKILTAVVFDNALTEEIVDIIDGHDTRKDALSINDKIVKDADKLTRFLKSSFYRLPFQREMSPEEICNRLEIAANKWFFLPVSQKIALKELHARRQEFKLIKSNPCG